MSALRKLLLPLLAIFVAGSVMTACDDGKKDEEQQQQQEEGEGKGQ